MRRNRKLTQDEVAELIGTTSQTVSRLETGKLPIYSHWMPDLAEAFGCAKADLLDDGPSPDERALLDAFRRLDPRTARKAVKLLEALGEDPDEDDDPVFDGDRTSAHG